jgi:phosphoribosylanthranilate isomerase
MLKIKICGITNLDDANAAIDSGADLLGFNFYPRSPRYLEPQAARKIIHQIRLGQSSVMTVGVFVNPKSPETIAQIVDEVGLSGVQLHGDESADFCLAVKDLIGDRLLIKALRVGENFQPETAATYPADAILLDADAGKRYGGSGHTFNWAIARRVREIVLRLFLAGGLSPDNVAEALSTVQPYGIDACSGLELSPGKKDHPRLKLFVHAARSR